MRDCFRCVRNDPLDGGERKGMLHERPDDFARISAALPPGKNGVANLHCTFRIWRPKVAPGTYQGSRAF